MSLRPFVAEVLRDHVTFELECIDRMYLNLYVPRLQHPSGVVGFFRSHRGQRFASSALMAPLTRAFVASLEAFASERAIPVITFRKGQRKDDVALKHLATHDGSEGILFIGKAQEKASVFRTERRRNPTTGIPYPFLVRSTAMVNHFYVYGFDRDFGPFFIKFCSYFPFTGKVGLNGHEWLKRQLERSGVPYEPLDNGIVSSPDPERVQAIARTLSAAKIETFIRRWLRILPRPFTRADRAAGYDYDISILQAEFSLTQTLDQPVVGRVFFEQVIRDNLDLGRADQVALIFDRRISRRTPGRLRTRVITQGVTPSLHVSFKHSLIMQYHKLGRALRTETTINDTRDFDIGRGFATFPRCGRSASKPTDVCSTSNEPAPTPSPEKTLSPRSPARRSSAPNAPRHCASAIRAPTPSSPPRSSVVSSPTGSPTASSGSILLPSSGVIPNP